MNSVLFAFVIGFWELQQLKSEEFRVSFFTKEETKGPMRVYVTTTSLRILTGVFVMFFVHGFCRAQVVCLPGRGRNLNTRAKNPLSVTIDLARQKQTIHGFGASDCWTVQFVGQWPVNKRMAIADLLFETSLDSRNNPKGIGLSIWRFNLGAGSSRRENINSVWRRADTFLSEDFKHYDWSRLPGQRWFLKAAMQRGVGQFDLFVNSPPIHMTKNGKAFCDANSGSTNLSDEKFTAFASYLVDVLKHFHKEEGLTFAYVSPVNEPEWDWEGPEQEGCRYDNPDMFLLVYMLCAEIRRQGLPTRILLPESGQIDYLYQNRSDRLNYIDYFFNVSGDTNIREMLGNRLCGHSYFTDTPETGLFVERKRLAEKLVQYPNLEYWMTEYCILGSEGHGRDLGIEPALHVARVIHYDLTVAQVSSWQWWLGISVYDYKDGLVYADKSFRDGNFYDSKILWALGNFSRFIRPGMKRVAVSRSDGAGPDDTIEGLLVSAYYDNHHHRVVLVFVNYQSQDVPVKLRFANAPHGYFTKTLIPYITSSKENLTACKEVSLQRVLLIPERSVVTFVTPALSADGVTVKE